MATKQVRERNMEAMHACKDLFMKLYTAKSKLPLSKQETAVYNFMKMNLPDSTYGWDRLNLFQFVQSSPLPITGHWSIHYVFCHRFYLLRYLRRE